MQITVFSVINLMILAWLGFIVAKILTSDWKLHLKECAYLVLANLFATITSIIIYAYLGDDILNAFVVVILLFLYFCMIKSYPAKKALTLILLAIIISSTGNLIVLTITNIFFPVYFYHLQSHPTSALELLQRSPFLLANVITSAFVAILFVSLTKKLRERINQNDKLQTVLAIISVTLFVFLQLAFTILHYQYEFLDFITSLNAFFLLGFSAIVFVGFYFYTRAFKEKLVLQQKETEQEILQYYTQQIEQQQTILRQFKNDHQKILLSIEGYLVANDDSRSNEYLYSSIKATSEAITNDNFTLDRLRNIRVPEIKATLAGKLMLAQSDGIDISFEANDIIDHIPVNSIDIVRMLSIIMDNAIEEVVELGSGKLMVACYVVGGGVTFVVQNTCRPDIQKLHELEQVGFSTKGAGRGLGLSNLAEIADTYPDNIMLHTNIEDGNFTQKLRVGGAW